jgi:gentisate 1,2-dioxygenase
MHRIAPGVRTAPTRVVGSSVWQVFEGSGTVTVGDTSWTVARGDLFVVPSWVPCSLRAADGLDLFTFSDAPIFEALKLEGPHA